MHTSPVTKCLFVAAIALALLGQMATYLSTFLKRLCLSHIGFGLGVAAVILGGIADRVKECPRKCRHLDWADLVFEIPTDEEAHRIRQSIVPFCLKPSGHGVPS